MKPVMNNTKNNMFTDEHLMWEIIALVFHIKRHNTESHLLYIYMNIQTHIYKFICISPCTNVYVHNHTRIYHHLVISVLYLLCGTFSFGFLKLMSRFQVQRPFLL